MLRRIGRAFLVFFILLGLLAFRLLWPIPLTDKLSSGELTTLAELLPACVIPSPLTFLLSVPEITGLGGNRACGGNSVAYGGKLSRSVVFLQNAAVCTQPSRQASTWIEMYG